MPISQWPPTLASNALDPRVTALEAAKRLTTFADHAGRVITGGGILTVSPGYVLSWTQRLMVIPSGHNAAYATSGFFEATQPPNGTVIPGVGGSIGTTVTAAGVPLVAWEALYYILPLGSSVTSIPANFRTVGYALDFDIPADWLLIAVHNADGAALGGPDTVKWCTGISMTPWVTPALSNGWLHYAVPYGPGRFRKVNGMVIGNGLLASGTIGTNAFVFPIGFRPGTTEVLTASTSPIASAYSEIRVRVDGSCQLTTGITGYMSLANINYFAEA
jgi:hypothetical protein